MKKSILFYAFFVFAIAACTPSTNSGNNNGEGSGDGDGNGNGNGNNNGGGGPFIYFPSQQKAAAMDARYAEWKNFYYRTIEQEIALKQEEADRISQFENEPAAQGTARILFQSDNDCQANGTSVVGICTVSEGIGYGMLITVFQNDEDAFRRLWKYAKYHQIASGTNYLMNWKLRSFVYGANRNGAGSATDADLDVATALLLGYKKWGDSEMRANALQIAEDIWNLEIRDGSKLIMPGNTAMWRNADSYNPSYFSPVAFRLFAEYDSGRDWNSVLDANYAWMEKISANGNLAPDWANEAGEPGQPPNCTSGTCIQTYRQYYFEAVRVPLRLIWDQAWYNEQRAKTILKRFADFVIAETGGDPSKISNRYNYAYGNQPNKSANSMAHNASLCAVGLTSPDYNAWLNDCNPTVVDTQIGEMSNTSYFQHILQVMYAQLLNGKYVKP